MQFSLALETDKSLNGLALCMRLVSLGVVVPSLNEAFWARVWLLIVWPLIGLACFAYQSFRLTMAEPHGLRGVREGSWGYPGDTMLRNEDALVTPRPPNGVFGYQHRLGDTLSSLEVSLREYVDLECELSLHDRKSSHVRRKVGNKQMPKTSCLYGVTGASP